MYWLLGIVVLAILIYLIVIRIIPSPNAQDNMVAVQCGNKTVYRYKNAEDMFPVITKDYATNFQIASGVLGKIAQDSGNSSLSVGVKNTAQSLMETLNQDNIFFQNTLKAYFFASNNDPCNDSLRYQYTAFIKDMTDKEIQLKQFVSQIANQPSQAPVSDTAGSKVIAVIDTSKGKVDTSAGKMPAQQNSLVVTNNYRKLDSAIKILANKYTVPSKLRVRHQ
jgi:hypothetical protein